MQPFCCLSYMMLKLTNEFVATIFAFFFNNFTERATDYPDNSVTSHLFSSGRRPDTAFQRYRNSRLGGEFHSEITGRSLSECLDECLRQTSFQCRYVLCMNLI